MSTLITYSLGQVQVVVLVAFVTQKLRDKTPASARLIGVDNTRVNIILTFRL